MKPIRFDPASIRLYQERILPVSENNLKDPIQDQDFISIRSGSCDPQSCTIRIRSESIHLTLARSLSYHPFHSWADPNRSTGNLVVSYCIKANHVRAVRCVRRACGLSGRVVATLSYRRGQAQLPWGQWGGPRGRIDVVLEVGDGGLQVPMTPCQHSTRAVAVLSGILRQAVAIAAVLPSQNSVGGGTGQQSGTRVGLSMAC